MLESYAGKTDEVSKAQYAAITKLYDQLYSLKGGWYDNVEAIDEINSAMLDTIQNIKEIRNAQLEAVTSAQNIMMDYLKAYYDKVKKEESDKHDEIISNIDDEISSCLSDSSF